MAWRERKTILAPCRLQVQALRHAPVPSAESLRQPECGAIDEMEDYRFADKKGHAVQLYRRPPGVHANPPQILRHGGLRGRRPVRSSISPTAKPAQLKVGMPVEMTFRKKYVDEVRGIHGYFWKAIPVRE